MLSQLCLIGERAILAAADALLFVKRQCGSG
jgi:hypothetical protein